MFHRHVPSFSLAFELVDLSNISDISPWARPKKIELLKITAAKIPGSGYHRGHTSALHIMCLTGKKTEKGAGLNK